MKCLGFDPDLHHSGIAIVENGKLLMVALTSAHHTAKGRRAAVENIASAAGIAWPNDEIDRAVIECPQIYRGGKNKADPADLINLALVSGGASDLIKRIYPGAAQGFVLPQEWKGTIPKMIHHKRICEDLGLKYTTDARDTRVIPTWPTDTVVIGTITPARAQHVLDACGMAVWASKLAAERHLVEARHLLK